MRDITGINGEDIIYSLDEISNGTNTYYIQLLGKKTGTTTVAFEMKQQIDTFSSPTGAIWTPYSDTAMPSVYPSVLYYNKWFVNKTMISYVVDMVSKSDFLDYQSMFANGTITISQFILGLSNPVSTALYNILYKFVLGVSGIITGIKSPFDFKQDVLDEVDEKAGYLGKNEYNFPVYRNGVSITLRMQEGLEFYSLETWNPDLMYGPEGWHGSWKVNPEI